MLKLLSCLVFLGFFPSCPVRGEPQQPPSSSVSAVSGTKSPSPSLSQSSSQQPLINITLYRNGTGVATKKLKADLKSGQQNVVYDKIPKTMNQTTLIATLDAEDAHVQLLGQYIDEESQGLVLEAFSAYDQVKILNLSYLFTGIEWDVYYSGLLSSDQKTLTLSGWIEITNHSGTRIDSAQVYFDGSPARVTPEGLTVIDHTKSNFHYLLPRIISLPEGKKIYVSFANAMKVPLHQENIIYVGGEYLTDLKSELQRPHVQRVVQFTNDDKMGFNAVLPEGKMTIYQVHANGLNEFVGHSLIKETPVSGSVLLQIVNDFGQSRVACQLEQTDYKKNSSRSSESGYRLVITNRTDNPFQVKVLLPLNDYEWTMVRSSLAYEVRGTQPSQEIFWNMGDILANGQPVEIKYRLKLDNTK